MSASISSSGRKWPSLRYSVTDRRAGHRLVAFRLGDFRREIVAPAAEARLDGDVREILGGQRAAARTAARRGTARRRAGGHCPASRSASAPPARHCRWSAGAAWPVRRSGASKWRASAGISPLRSRSGGRMTTVTPIRSARPGSNSSRQRAAGRGDDPDVDRIAAVAADRADFAGGQHAVERFLGFGRQRGDFVEQQGAAIGLDDAAVLGRESAGEGAFFMAEQFAVDDVGRGSTCSRR